MFYKVVLNQTASGVKMQTILYYRTAPGAILDGLLFGGAEAVANNVKQEIWDNPMKQYCPTGHVLDDISVYVLDDLFTLNYSLPFVLAVGEAGTRATPNFSPGAVINVRFNLEPLIGANILLGPRRGYVALPSVAEEWVLGSGLLDPAILGNALHSVRLLAQKLTENLQELTPPMLWYPIRVRVIRNPITGSPLWTGYADIKGSSIDEVVSWRRSRKPGVGS